jgi:antitoxin ParD1/3/4
MITVTITLRDEDHRFIESAMKSGRYVTESEAVSDAIAELRAREELRQARIAEIRDKVMVGIDQLERGEGTEWNVEDVKAKGRALLASRKIVA